MPVYHASFIEGEDKIIYNLQQVKSDIQSAFRTLASSLDVSLNRDDFPKVHVQLGINSQYNFLSHTISIRPADVGNGDLYFHDASSALRNLLTGEHTSDTLDRRIQEFFGYVGIILGRKLFLRAKLEHLFVNSDSLEEYFSKSKQFYQKKPEDTQFKLGDEWGFL